MTARYSFPRAALAVDAVVFGLDDRGLQVLLIRRALEPFRGRWALPGGFVHVDESVDEAARRELREETGLERVYLEQLHTFGAVERDPRERVVTVAYTALVNLRDHRLHAATDAERAAWFDVGDLPRVAFDHATILRAALAGLQDKVRRRPIGFELLPPRFTLSQLQSLYETILERRLDKRNFRKKVLGLGLLQDTGEVEEDVAHRAARLFRFDRAGYDRMTRRGFNFEI